MIDLLFFIRFEKSKKIPRPIRLYSALNTFDNMFLDSESFATESRIS